MGLMILFVATGRKLTLNLSLAVFTSGLKILLLFYQLTHDVFPIYGTLLAPTVQLILCIAHQYSLPQECRL